jgi:hypothetical protein
MRRTNPNYPRTHESCAGGYFQLPEAHPNPHPHPREAPPRRRPSTGSGSGRPSSPAPETSLRSRGGSRPACRGRTCRSSSPRRRPPRVTCPILPSSPHLAVRDEKIERRQRMRLAPRASLAPRARATPRNGAGTPRPLSRHRRPRARPETLSFPWKDAFLCAFSSTYLAWISGRLARPPRISRLFANFTPGVLAIAGLLPRATLRELG